MPFQFYKGDILELDVDAIVIPHLPHDDIIPPESRHILDAACKDESNIIIIMDDLNYKRGNATLRNEMTSESDFYDGFYLGGKYDFPEITVLGGYDLKAEYTIHICVPILEPLNIDGEELDGLKRCYIMSLIVADLYDAKRLAIPLLGTGIFGFSYDEAYEIAERAVYSWLGAHEDLNMTVYVVLPDEIENEQDLPLPDFGAGSVFVGYAERMAREIAHSRKNRFVFFRERVEYYLSRCPYSDSELESMIDCDHTTISRLRTGKTSATNKRRAVALAVCMGLRGYEFYEFVVSAAIKHNYPSDNFDKAVETVLASGAVGLRKIDAELSAIDPEYSLCAPARKNKGL